MDRPADDQAQAKVWLENTICGHRLGADRNLEKNHAYVALHHSLASVGRPDWFTACFAKNSMLGYC